MVRHTRKTYKARAHKPTRRHTRKIDQNAGGFWDRVKGVFRKKENVLVSKTDAKEQNVPKGNTPNAAMLTNKPKPLVNPAKLGWFARFVRKKSSRKNTGISGERLLQPTKITSRRQNSAKKTKRFGFSRKHSTQLIRQNIMTPKSESNEKNIFDLFDNKMDILKEKNGLFDSIFKWFNKESNKFMYKGYQSMKKHDENICSNFPKELINDLNLADSSDRLYRTWFEFQNNDSINPYSIYILYIYILYGYMVWFMSNNLNDTTLETLYENSKTCLSNNSSKDLIDNCFKIYKDLIGIKYPKSNFNGTNVLAKKGKLLFGNTKAANNIAVKRTE